MISVNARYLLAGRGQDDFIVGCALCKTDCCKTTKIEDALISGILAKTFHGQPLLIF